MTDSAAPPALPSEMDPPGSGRHARRSRAIALFAAGLGLADIARELGTSRQNVHGILRRAGLDPAARRAAREEAARLAEPPEAVADARLAAARGSRALLEAYALYWLAHHAEAA